MNFQPSKKQVDNGTYKLMHGRWYKRCTGPAHEEPEYLPASDKYFYRYKSGKNKGKFVPRCRLCINWHKVKSPGSYHGEVPIRLVRPFFIEAANRIGVRELSRRTGVSEATIRKAIMDDEGMMRKVGVRKVMLELTSLQRKNEISIGPHSRWRQERRNAKGHGRCSGCGGLERNVTRDCYTCYERHRGWYRRGVITLDAWEKVKADFRDTNK